MTVPTSMKLSGGYGGHIIKWEWYLTAARESMESFLHLLLREMGRAADLNEFVRGQIVIAQRLRTSISETAQLIRCPWSAIVSIYTKWVSDNETSSRCQEVGHLGIIKEKERWRLSCLVKQNWCQIVAQSTYNASALEHSSVNTVGYGTVKQTS